MYFSADLMLRLLTWGISSCRRMYSSPIGDLRIRDPIRSENTSTLLESGSSAGCRHWKLLRQNIETWNISVEDSYSP